MLTYRKFRKVKMSLELLKARERAKKDVHTLNHQDVGFIAGIPRFAMVFGRDLEKFAYAMLRYKANARISGVAEGIEKATDLLFAHQGTGLNPLTEEKPGRLPHQVANGFTPKEEFDKLEEGGFTVEVINGERVIRYYGAMDTTPGGIIIVSAMADAKGMLASDDSRQKTKEKVIGKYYPRLVEAFKHEKDYADPDGNGLSESTPKNKKLLLHFTERDSSYTYDLEDGKKPHPPFIYLGPNIVRYVALQKMVDIAEMSGDGNLRNEAKEMALITRNQILTRFYMPYERYFTPLLYGPGKRQARIINDEPLDLMYYQVLDPEKDRKLVEQIVWRSSQPDILTPWGHLSLSNLSSRFRRNGPMAYWNGAIWMHRIGQNAQALDNYGYHDQASGLDEILPRVQRRFGGSVENFTLNQRGNPVRYIERDRNGHVIGTACLPQLFAAALTMERTAYLERAA